MDWFDLLELVLELLFELVVPVVAELLADIGSSRKRPAAPAFPWAWILLTGTAVGTASALIWPRRLLREGTIVPGASLLLAPLLAARVMGVVGERLRDRGITPTALASARGGAVFAFGMALARFLMVALK
ncbi:MAG TPA: hypothetical protein VKE70_02090 [Candidatus Solibacter sp.]|nr:hypothetical protein [Candidatus Solibacter sp.]